MGRDGHPNHWDESPEKDSKRVTRDRCPRKCNRTVTGFRDTMPCVPPRLAPALGLAAACVMLSAVGAYAIETADNPKQPSGFAGAIALTGPARLTGPAQFGGAGVSSGNTSRTSRPAATPTPRTSLPANPDAVPPTGSATDSASAPAGQTLHAKSATPAEDYAHAVFQAVNRARAAQHLAPLTWDVRLQQSAHAHNRVMAGSNTLSHQVDAEPSLGSRESSAGVQWSYAAENIGWTTVRSLAGVLDIESRMQAEAAPNDAHRRNILSAQAQAIGVDVYYDAAHSRLWLTEDFSGS